MTPVLSIVTVTYNAEQHIRENFDSVSALFDSHQVKLQHVIIDGLSTDNTNNIIQSYKDSVPYNVHYISEKDAGLYDAMNKGVSLASGNWILLLNADDYLLPDGLLEVLQQPDTEQNDILACATLWGKSVIKSETRKAKFLPQGHLSAPHQGQLVKKSFYETYGGFDLKWRVYADQMYNHKYYKHARIKLIETPIAFQRTGGISNSSTKQGEWERFKFVVFYQKCSIRKKWRVFRSYLLYKLSKLK